MFYSRLDVRRWFVLSNVLSVSCVACERNPERSDGLNEHPCQLHTMLDHMSEVDDERLFVAFRALRLAGCRAALLIAPAMSFFVAPAANSPRIKRSRETVGSLASILATRD